MPIKTPVETTHPISEAERVSEQAALSAIGAHFAGSAGSMRDAYDAMSAMTPIAAGITTEAVDTGAIKGWWVRPAAAPADRAILFLHGGAYVLGSAKAYRGFVSQLVARSGIAAFVPDYPLAPEQPFPAAFDAVAAARSWLGSQGVTQLALIGDSAGGALSLATLGDDRADWPNVSSVVVFSPWIDLTLSGPSFLDPATYDPIFKPAILTAAVEKYLGNADPRDGRASPLYAVPQRLPPLLIQVGTDELLLDDSRRYAAAAAARGGEVRLDIFEGMHHVFQRSTDELASARKALDDSARFLSDHWQ